MPKNKYSEILASYYETYYICYINNHKMKKLTLLLVLALIGFTASAQSSDAYLSTQYLGYVGGKHSIRVTNKLSCTTDIQFRFGGTVIAVSPNPKNNTQQNTVNGSSSQVFEITGDQRLTIEVKALSVCSSGSGSAPAWLNPLANALPVTFKKVMLEQTGRTVKITIYVDKEMKVSRYNIRVAKDGLNFTTVAIIFPADVVAPGTYVASIVL